MPVFTQADAKLQTLFEISVVFAQLFDKYIFMGGI